MDQIKPGDIVSIRSPCRIAQTNSSVGMVFLVKNLDEFLRNSGYSFCKTGDLNFALIKAMSRTGKIMPYGPQGGLQNDSIGIIFGIYGENITKTELFHCGAKLFVLDVFAGPVFDVTKPFRNRTVQLITLLYEEKKYLFAVWSEEIEDYLRKIA